MRSAGRASRHAGSSPSSGVSLVGLLALLVAFAVPTAGCTHTDQQKPASTSPVRSADSSRAATVAAMSGPTAKVQGDAESPVDVDTVNAYLRGLGKGRSIGEGDPERGPILEALRSTAEHDLGQPVRFIVDRLRIGGGFAALRGRTVRPDGGKINYLKTRHKAAVEAGAFDDQIVALLQKEGGRWSVLECDIGDTDWPGDHWLYQHRVPYDLFAQ
jgi:hypothetical protein